MTVNNRELGRCPHCERGVPAHELVIEYRSADDTRITAARCPTCVALVTLE